MWKHLRDTKPVARRRHRCYLCGQGILVGERYVRRVGTDDGRMHSFAMHIRCEVETQSWDENDWLYHDEAEFRRYELGEGYLCGERRRGQ